jgi:hypothetical protein
MCGSGIARKPRSAAAPQKGASAGRRRGEAEAAPIKGAHCASGPYQGRERHSPHVRDSQQKPGAPRCGSGNRA